MELISKKQRNFRFRAALQNTFNFPLKTPPFKLFSFENRIRLIFMESKLDISEKGCYNLDVKFTFHKRRCAYEKQAG